MWICTDYNIPKAHWNPWGALRQCTIYIHEVLSASVRSISMRCSPPVYDLYPWGALRQCTIYIHEVLSASVDGTDVTSGLHEVGTPPPLDSQTLVPRPKWQICVTLVPRDPARGIPQQEVKKSHTHLLISSGRTAPTPTLEFSSTLQSCTWTLVPPHPNFGNTPTPDFGPTPAPDFGPTPTPDFGPTPIPDFNPAPTLDFGPTPAPDFGPTVTPWVWDKSRGWAWD